METRINVQKWAGNDMQLDESASKNQAGLDFFFIFRRIVKTEYCSLLW